MQRPISFEQALCGCIVNGPSDFISGRAQGTHRGRGIDFYERNEQPHDSFMICCGRQAMGVNQKGLRHM